MPKAVIDPKGSSIEKKSTTLISFWERKNWGVVSGNNPVIH